MDPLALALLISAGVLVLLKSRAGSSSPAVSQVPPDQQGPAGPNQTPQTPLPVAPPQTAEQIATYGGTSIDLLRQTYPDAQYGTPGEIWLDGVWVAFCPAGTKRVRTGASFDTCQPTGYVMPGSTTPTPTAGAPTVPTSDADPLVNYGAFVSSVQPQLLAADPGGNFYGAALQIYRYGAERTPLDLVLAGQSAPTATPPVDYGTWIDSYVPQLVRARQNAGYGIGQTDAYLDGYRLFNEGWQWPAVLGAVTGPVVPPDGGGGGEQPPSGTLPAVPDRVTLGTVKAYGFQGVMTQGVMSWGPDIPTLPSQADRLERLRAHKAIGSSHVVFILYGHYPNISAPLNADFRNDLGTLYLRCLEAISVGLWPVLSLGADELAFEDVTAMVPAVVAAMRGSAGDISQMIVWLSGLDSVVPIGNQDRGRVEAMRAMMLGIRAAIGAGVQAFELPAGWSFWGPEEYSGAGSYTDAAGQAVDVWLQEFGAPPGVPGPSPILVGGSWDPEHNNYAAVFDNPDQGSRYQQIWQIAGRTTAYVAPPDQPFHVPVRVTGGPQDGQIVPVSADSDHPPRYSGKGTPRGADIWIAFEYATYDRTHQDSAAIPDSGLTTCRAYFESIGYNASS